MSIEKLQEQAHALFEYIKEVCLLGQQKILDVNKQMGVVLLRSLDDPSCVTIASRDRSDGAAEYDDDCLFSFRKPDFTACPSPDESLIKWLMPGWQDYQRQAEHLEKIETEFEKGTAKDAQKLLPSEELDKEPSDIPVEHFTDDPKRVERFETWVEKRETWVEHEKHTARLRGIFNDLFDMYSLCRQSPDTLEIVIGNGMLTDKKNKEIRHPLLLKRARLLLDPIGNTLTLFDTDEPAQIYLPMFSVMEDINSDVVRPLEKRAEEENIHPWDHYEGADLLKSVAHQLHASSRYLNDGEEAARTDERILVRWEPCVVLRKRPDGTIKALQSILGDLAEGAEIPSSMRGILGNFDHDGCKRDEDGAVDSGAVETWAEPKQTPLEDEEILLPKLANREQMQIVRQIEHAPAVLVQGPPGTGKTHTIANLLGHFLAKGQTVLVTSHTSKALTVLKEKVPEEIQALCVAVFGDNRQDMEESINAIIEHTTLYGLAAQKAEEEKIRAERHQLLLKLKKARELVYAIRHKEFEPIVYCGESWSPSKAAEYIFAHEDLMGLIPGTIVQNVPFPLSAEELAWLYESNGRISVQEEVELSAGLPGADALMTAQQLADSMELLARLKLQLQAINAGGRVNLAWKENRYAVVDQLTDQVFATQGSPAAEAALRETLSVYEEPIPGWAAFAMSDGAEEGLARKRWEQLLTRIDETYSKAQVVLEKQLTRPIKLLVSSYETLKNPYEELCKDAEKHGHVKKSLFMSKEKKNALDSVTIAGNAPESHEDMKSVLAYLELLTCREQLAQLWNTLVAAHGARRFDELGEEPERRCKQQQKAIELWLNWVRKGRTQLCEQAKAAGIGDLSLQPISSFLSFSDDRAAHMIEHIQTQLIPAISLLHLVNELYISARGKENTREQLEAHGNSALCTNLWQALAAESVESYARAREMLTSVLEKAELQKHRSELINKIAVSAPGWAEAVRKREGSHGQTSVPENLLTAWKVRQLAFAIDEITSTPLSEAENRVSMLSDQYRKTTERLATTLAWCNLQQRIDKNPGVRQALNGWKQTIAKIGKGTGKRVAGLRAEARKLMAECQKAVPAWIMPVSSVMNSMDPTNTQFDVIIVDEASQSDITASAILYMGRKIIVVGDDEQVSPMAVGLDEAKMQNLMNILIKDKIPNAHLWDAKTSLYDIAAQVYQPLMLREHFRCVPDIIGYSNMLSYRGKIKPLREAGSSPFKTAIVPFRVAGIRKGRSKTNEEEADAIVALIKACMEHPEYEDKSFGVISMLGDDQVKLIGRKLADGIPLAEYEKHQILCGNASIFQGDERDVIFLSLVDSNESDGPLAMASGEGQGANGKAMRQRYNVAVSRAKDQLWIVHSLDYTADLKPGDMRRRLLEYASNPQAFASRNDAIEEASDSPFEAEVAKALVAQGYHVVQQWQVGAYWIDMVAICGNKRIAIECDGERWHSGEAKILEDMERQSILERLGWKFIRVRGSEYYRRPAQTIARIVSELNAAGIEPEAGSAEVNHDAEDTLVSDIRVRAMQLMREEDATEMKPFTSANEPESDQKLSESPMEHEVREEVGHSEEMRPVMNSAQVNGSVSTRSEKAVRTEQRRNRPTAFAEQISMFEPEEDMLTALENVGFACIDNRDSSGILWVLYDDGKVEAFREIERQYLIKATLEKRGAVATGGAPAWRILVRKG